jgi:pantoate--beta-alanine ligase
MRTRIVEPGQGVATIEAQARERLAQAGLVADYAAIRRADDLGEPTVTRRDGLIALIAARLGPTQLIDNMLFDV